MDQRPALLASLQKALHEDHIDVSYILALSTELAKQDPETVRFFADAGLIRRLGYELVSRQETAVSELVKNAYDADATHVDLIFHEADEPGGTLEIHDDGTGMTREDLVEGFMRLSSTSKIREPLSPLYKRHRAGRKGIGRFAAQRLGKRLTITTKTKNADHALRVVINWEMFEAGQDLTAIPSRIEEVEEDRQEGTTLLIEHLRDAWTESQMRRVWRYVSELIQPFPLAKVHAPTLIHADPGFRAAIYRAHGTAHVLIVDEQTQIYEHAVAEIDAEVDSAGRGYWSIQSRLWPQINDVFIPLGADSEDASKPFVHVRDVRLKAYYFIYQVGLIPRMMERTIRELARQRGGIRLYRNGFRVLPYGEESDDWLGLDKAYARRHILAPIANLNFFGFVEITDPEGTRFEETSSREGLIKNDALDELTDFVFRVLRAAVIRVAEARETKPTAGGRPLQSIAEAPEEKVRKAMDELRRFTEAREAQGDETSINAATERAALTTTLARLDEGVVELQREKIDLLDELGMLRVLASLGIVIAEFTHEIRSTMTAASLNARHLVRTVQEPDSARDIVRQLVSNVDRIDAYARYFDRAIQDNTQRKLVPQELRKTIHEFIREMQPSAERRAVEIACDIQGYNLYTCPMHSSELASLLFNFYSNALKAIRRAHSSPGRILLRCGQKGDKLFLDFADNGDGVPVEVQERIFHPFFTTATYGSAEFDDDLRGSGLGLKIVQDVATSYGGDVSLIVPPPDFTTCFHVTLPGAREEEVDVYDL